MVLRIIVILTITLSLFGQTERQGVIKKNERWTLENSPYLITDDLLVSVNARLVITPGVRILIGRPLAFHPDIKQIDHNDSFAISIKVEGALKCVGRSENRITFSSQFEDPRKCQWYGIIFESHREGEIEMAYCDVVDACKAVSIRKGSPVIRNSVFEFNSVGVLITHTSRPRIFNCVIVHNFSSGVIVKKANPSILNSIIAFNRDQGILSDNVSLLTLEYNCIYGNQERDLIGCNPKFGIAKKVNKNKDSTDFAHNLFADPIFAGSTADSLAIELDHSLRTDKSRIKDTTLAKIIQGTLTDSTAQKWISRKFERYSLSSYSPCINAGKPSKIFRDTDESRNDIGIYGGQEFVEY